MEIQFFLSIIITFTLSLFFLLKVVSAYKSTYLLTRKKKFPPGPWKLPVIGNLHQLIGSLQKPQHGVTELAKKYGDLMHLQLGNLSVVVVSSREMATKVLKEHDLAFADRPELHSATMPPNIGRYIAGSKYNEYWKQMRRLFMSELLSTKRVQSFSSLREEEASNMIESIYSCANSNINLTEKMFSCTGNIICRAAFGSKSKDQLALVSIANEMMIQAADFSLTEMFPSLKYVHVINGMKAKFEMMYEEADKILENIISEHGEKRRSSYHYGEVPEPEKEDLLHVLLRVQKSGNLEVPITKEDIKANIWELFVGGTYTLSTTITWAMVEMMRHPRVMEKAQAEIRKMLKEKRRSITVTDIQELNYLKLIIKETLRLHIPVPFIVPRECREKCEINGYEIPTKTKVLINAWALSRDPKYWDDPECFIPERFSNKSIDFNGTNIEYIPFGAGRRMCPGVTFGTANIEILLANLLYHFHWKLPDGIEPENLDMTEVYGAVVRKKSDLIVIATPHFAPDVLLQIIYVVCCKK